MKVLRATSALTLSLALWPAVSAAAAAPSPDSGGIEAVTVTAERRAENIQKSALSIQAFSGETLARAGVTDPTGLENIVPGVNIGEAGPTVQTYIRGVGNFATDATAESAIAYNIDGIYISRPDAIGPIFYDLQRVEVLKGPQGTLYGRNASGGAINIITREPTQRFGGYLTAEAGNYGLKQLQGAVNLPLTNTLAVRGAFQVVDRDGYLTDGYNDQKSQAGRITALWRPNADVSLKVMGEYTHVGGMGQAAVIKPAVTSNPWLGPSSPLEQPPSYYLGGTPIKDDGYNDNTVQAISAELNWNLGPVTMTFLPAYRYFSGHFLTYTPGFRFGSDETSREQSYELRFAHNTKRIKWVIGAYYFKEKQGQIYSVDAVPFQKSGVNTPLGTESEALFGQLTYSIRPDLRLIGGLRYTHELKYQGGVSLAVLPSPGVEPADGERSFNATNWKAGIEYDVAPKSMLYFTVATGFKSGGFFPAPPPNNSFGSEKLTAYELGSRNRFLNDHLQINLEGFYWDYKNQQERYLGILPSGVTGLLTTNAGAAALYGADVDITYKPTDVDLFHFTMEYLHTRYDSFAYDVYNPPVPFVPMNYYDPTATGCQLGAVVPVPGGAPNDSTQTLNCAGEPLVKAPNWSGSFRYERTIPFADDSFLVLGGDVQFASAQYLSTDYIASVKQGAYALLNLDATYHFPDGQWELGVWMRNVANTAVYSGGYRYPFSLHPPAGDPSLFYANIRPPRTFGARLSYHF